MEEHPAEQLWQQHGRVGPYPDGVLPVPEPIRGTAFFPGGFGLWRPNPAEPLPQMPVGGVMVLGQDFHSEEGYRASRELGQERMTLPTWCNLFKLLDRAEISAEDCFFNNAYMGLRAGRATTGKFPGARDKAFVGRCRNFLAEQLKVQRPRLILTLGSYAPRVLAPLASELSDWLTGASLKDIDRPPAAATRSMAK